MGKVITLGLDQQTHDALRSCEGGSVRLLFDIRSYPFALSRATRGACHSLQKSCSPLATSCHATV